jgi:hypothetical protein
MRPTWFRSASTTLVACVALAAAGCGNQTPAGQSSQTGRAILNATTAAELIDAFTKAGLPVPNAHDVTQTKCPPISCTDAIATDTVTVIKFASTGAAQRFAGTTPDVYQIEDIVLVFSHVPAEQQTAFEQVARRAL